MNFCSSHLLPVRAIIRYIIPPSVCPWAFVRLSAWLVTLQSITSPTLNESSSNPVISLQCYLIAVYTSTAFLLSQKSENCVCPVKLYRCCIKIDLNFNFLIRDVSCMVHIICKIFTVQTTVIFVTILLSNVEIYSTAISSQNSRYSIFRTRQLIYS